MPPPKKENVMPKVPKSSARETKRLERKKQMAEAQAAQFEDELSSHELNLLRLESIPEADRDENWSAAHAQATQTIATLENAISVTLDAAK